MRLTIELVPSSTWFTNVRSLLSANQWDELKKETFLAAKRRCEICGGRGRRWPVECHERWEYKPQLKRQRLIGLIALCPPCHEVKHMGFAIGQGYGERALRHLMQVNDLSREAAQAYMLAAFDEWAVRTKEAWEVDISWLQDRSLAITAT